MKKTKGTPRKEVSISEKVLHLAFELSQNKWKLGFSDGDKMRFKSIGARNLVQKHAILSQFSHIQYVDIPPQNWYFTSVIHFVV